MKKNMGVLLALTLILCFGFPASTLADLYTFASIPWDTKPEALIDVFYEKTGIILEKPADYLPARAADDQSLTVAGKEVKAMHVYSSNETDTFTGVSITFNNPDYSISFSSKQAYYKEFVFDLLDLMNQLTTKYGDYDAAILTLEPEQYSHTSYLLEPVTSSEDWYRFSDICLDNFTASLRIYWGNITLSCKVVNDTSTPECHSTLQYSSSLSEMSLPSETFDLNLVNSRDSVSLGI